MNRSQFLPKIAQDELQELKQQEDYGAIYDLLALPLHEELYKRQDFSFIETLSPGQELMIRYDYVRMQVLQGGFIQLIQNGYISLLPPMPAMLTQLEAADMAKLLDDVLKVYALNVEYLSKETSVEEFAKLYDEFKEFELLDQQFTELNPKTERALVDYALKYPDEFMM
jgi:hypothetical protein